MTIYVLTRIYADAADAAGTGTANATYATAREATDATTTTTTTGRVGQRAVAGPNYQTYQYFPVFDTSTVPAVVSTATFSFLTGGVAFVAGDILELRAASSASNVIAGSALAAQTPLFGSWTVVTGTNTRRTVSLTGITGMARSASCTMLFHSQKQRLGTTPTGEDAPTLNLSEASGTTNDPYFEYMPVPWSFVGVSAVVETLTTTLNLTEPAGVADGDLLIATIASRTTATTAISNTGWTAVNSQNTNNTTASTSGIASGTMLYQVRAGTPDLSFTLPAGISVALGRIVAYRGNATTTPLDVSTAATTAAVTTACSWTGLTTTQDDDLIVAMVAGGQEAAWSAFNNVTTPIGASGATDTASAPSPTAWIERADSLTTNGADTSLAIFDAVRTGTGATGNLTATASVGGGNVVIAGAFKILPPTADAWNYQDKSSNITLSASDKTATTTSASSGGVRSSTAITNEAAGKWYAEFVVGSTPMPRLGIQPTSNSLTATNPGFNTITGNIIVNNVSVVTSAFTTPVSGDVVCVAWDSGAELVWFRLNGGIWNKNAAADPATGTTGVNVSSAAAGTHNLWAFANVSGASATIRTELAEFTQAVPSGFTSWMGETPPRILTADAGSYALTGADVTLTKAGGAVSTYTLVADAGSYALSGATAELYRGWEVLTVAGTYAVSGATTSLEVGREVAADAGAYALTGTTVSLELGKEVLALGGTYAITGTTATLRHGWTIAADGSSYALNGTAATLTKGAAIIHRTIAGRSGCLCAGRNCYQPRTGQGSSRRRWFLCADRNPCQSGIWAGSCGCRWFLCSGRNSNQPRTGLGSCCWRWLLCADWDCSNLPTHMERHCRQWFLCNHRHSGQSADGRRTGHHRPARYLCAFWRRGFAGNRP